MKRRRAYGGKAGVFKAGDGWRQINRKGIVKNVQLPSGQTAPSDDMRIKNPFRQGQWSWAKARQAGQGGGPQKPKPVTPKPPGPTPLPEVTGPYGQWGGSQYVGPWVEGFQTAGTPWVPMTGGGFINLATGQPWRPDTPVSTGYDQYEQSLMDTLSGLLKGFG